MIIRPLANCNIVVTRPLGSGESLLFRLRNAGATAVHLPVMEIAPLPCDRIAAVADIIIFISGNAVKHGLSVMGGSEAIQAAQRQGSKVLAIGSATAEALLQQQITTDNGATGVQRFDSDSLLSDCLLNDVSGQRIQLIRGVGGREKLQNTLTERGAAVDIIEVYERRPSQHRQAKPITELLHSADVVTVASGESLILLRERLLEQSPSRFAELWSQIKLIVPSERVLQTALKSGIITAPLVAKNATDTEMFAAVLRATRSKARTSIASESRWSA